MTTKLACPNCDGSRFACPFEVEGKAVVRCYDCSTQIGTLAEIRERMVEPTAPAWQDSCRGSSAKDTG